VRADAGNRAEPIIPRVSFSGYS